MMSSTARCLNRLALRSLPSLAAAHQSCASIPSFAIPPMTSPLPVAATTSCTTRLFSAAVPAEHEGNNISHAMEMLSKANAVCFDVDSTVIDEEGIDVLADTLGKGPEVAAWTAKAMDGNIKFEDALAARLEIIKPSKSDIASCLEKHPLRLSPGVDKLVEALHKRGTDVYLVSGGFRLMIEPVAERLGVSVERIYANTITFDENGDYTGFDSTEPTSADQGKPKALMAIKEKYGYETMIMVGDGATDAQAKPPADAFIGFGGVVTRSAVKAKACWFVKDFQAMIDIVENKQ
mmetsp:Transcript_20948/g.37557  ORF Transcript_20948/g.37557 Transcript_20948/m.37557 type:complete len:292 (-) Transcript_20948:244-1119(-)|eukprot:CAMPEP_0201609554 /NCGR_PEP_ID=MMETSP0492-20130828/14011_1 /ASSEMBLY_ACC=CAM_ASM_000837 /TAXON_ID=420259 /ORGANISM="Thalassiosira gravida, Strain GMp14c1" /LENGTH=291 /DNA_ID=CAMNT_0048075065 /DNA_START=115 /DNA_END=990 /DNA_ORIENTATION=+